MVPVPGLETTSTLVCTELITNHNSWKIKKKKSLDTPRRRSVSHLGNLNTSHGSVKALQDKQALKTRFREKKREYFQVLTQKCNSLKSSSFDCKSIFKYE